MIIVLLILLALVGMPLFAVLALGAVHGFHSAELSPTLLAMEFQRIGESPALVTLPLFTFAGVLLAHGKTAARLIDFTRSVFGWLPGQVVIPGFFLLALIGAFSGATTLMVLALGALLLPTLVQAGYPRERTLGLTLLASSPGVLLAPSLPLILYAVLVQQVAPGRGVGFDELFLAGLLPAVLMIAILAGCAISIRGDWPVQSSQPPPLGTSFKAIAWELPLPFVVLGGIYSGWLTIVDAAVVTAGWLLVSLVLIRRELPWAKLAAVVTEAMMLAAAILVVFGMSMAATNLVIDAGVPHRLVEWLSPWIDKQIIFLLLAGLLLVLAGRVLGLFAALLILAPLSIPMALAFGIDPLHFGIVLLLCLQIGNLMSPAGGGLLIASRAFGEDAATLNRAILPILGLLLITLLVIIAWPPLSLWLPGWLA